MTGLPSLVFALAPLLLIAFGAWAGIFPIVARLDTSGRLSLFFIIGSVVLSVEAVLFSFMGLSWSVWGLAAVPIAATLVLAARRRSNREVGTPTEASSETFGFAQILSFLIAGVMMAVFALYLLTARCTNVDFLFFWGVKGHLFAQAKGIDAAFLRNELSASAPLFLCLG